MISSTNWLKDVGYGAGGSTSPGLVSVKLREVDSGLGEMLFTMKGSDAEAMTDMPLAREEDC